MSFKCLVPSRFHASPPTVCPESLHMLPCRLSEKSAFRSVNGLLRYSGRGRNSRRGTFRTGSPAIQASYQPLSSLFPDPFQPQSNASLQPQVLFECKDMYIFRYIAIQGTNFLKIFLAEIDRNGQITSPPARPKSQHFRVQSAFCDTLAEVEVT